MSISAAVWLVILVSGIAANLPFVTKRLFIVGPRRERKSLAWCLLELLVMWGLTLAIGSALEARIGQRQPQGWEFYAAFGCLFLTFGFPGFVWRYLRRRKVSHG
jgi:Na+(H+)/acetate symporter ActP